MALIYHITRRADWQVAQTAGAYRAGSLDSEGFIHCSTAAQVCGVADAFYRGQADLVLLSIDPARLTADLRWEAPSPPSPGFDGQFPHIYGPINLDAVARVVDFPPGPDGRFTLPTGVSEG